MSRRDCRGITILLVCLGGCPRRDALPTAPPPPQSTGSKVALPDGGLHHTERLATLSWRHDGMVRACGVRSLRPFGCREAPTAGGADPFIEDRSPYDAAPGSCRMRFDDAPGDPGAPPARATLVDPTHSQLLDEWLPPNTVDGDYFAIETSFSPDGKWLAIVHSSVGIGEGDRLVTVVDVAVRPAPSCR